MFIGVLFPVSAYATVTLTYQPINLTQECSNANSTSSVCNTNKGLGDVIGAVINVLFGTLFAVAVIVIVVAGIRMTASGGNPDAVKNAKNMIIYAIVGMIIVVLSYAIVQFVVDRI